MPLILNTPEGMRASLACLDERVCHVQENGLVPHENGNAAHADVPAGTGAGAGLEHCAVVRVEGPLVFANAQFIRDRITAFEVRLARGCPRPLRVLRWSGSAPRLLCMV